MQFSTIRRGNVSQRADCEITPWKIHKTGPHHYEGTFDEIVGVAKGLQYGNALNWNYEMNLKVGDGTWRVSFDDWMFLQPDGLGELHVLGLFLKVEEGVRQGVERLLSAAEGGADALAPPSNWDSIKDMRHSPGTLECFGRWRSQKLEFLIFKPT